MKVEHLHEYYIRFTQTQYRLYLKLHITFPPPLSQKKGIRKKRIYLAVSKFCNRHVLEDATWGLKIFF